MYEAYFGLTERPFSIAPDPQYLYMSSRHQEAMAHLSYGLTQGGCFIVLTGEVGTGKTTLCRNLLVELPENLDVALILNANINETELLQTICDELRIDYGQSTSQKQLLDLINQYLLETFAQNRHTVLIIDEAQLLSRNVLEQIRLLTNLETTKSKLLQIILIGQPELNDLLSRNDLRQLAQRVTARYHLGALHRNEIQDYIHFRLSVAGCKKPLFSRQALNRLHSLTDGIPRKINVLADHALLAAYSNNQPLVDAKSIKTAAKDVFIQGTSGNDLPSGIPKWAIAFCALALLNIGLWWYFSGGEDSSIRNLPREQVLNKNPQVSTNVLPAVRNEAGSLDFKPQVPGNALASPQIEEQQLSAAQANTNEPDPNSQTTGDLAIAINSQTNPDQIKPGLVIVADELLDATTNLPASVLLSDQIESPLETDSVNTQPSENNKAVSGNTDLARLLETSSDLTGNIAAARQLAAIWQVELPPQMMKPACREILESGLSCIGFSSIAKLKLYNRPAIVVLRHNDQLYRVIVESITPDKVQLLVGANRIEISQIELESRWSDDALLYWRPTEAGASLLQYGSNNASVVRVRDLVNRALDATNMPLLESVEDSQFDLDLSQKVFILQSRFGIATDSKIGNETYLLMNEIVLPDSTPTLRHRLL